MTAAENKVLLEALTLPTEARADLVDRLIASLAQSESAAVQQAHLREVRRRVAQVDAGEVELIPADVALRHVRERIAAAS